MPLTESDARELDREDLDGKRMRDVLMLLDKLVGEGVPIEKTRGPLELLRKAEIPAPNIYMERFRASQRQATSRNSGGP